MSVIARLIETAATKEGNDSGIQRQRQRQRQRPDQGKKSVQNF